MEDQGERWIVLILWLKMRLRQTLDGLAHHSIGYLLQKRFFHTRRAVPARMALKADDGFSGLLEEKGCRVVLEEPGAQPSSLLDGVPFLVANRRLKRDYYRRKGLGGVFLVRDGKVIGDAWFADLESSHYSNAHPDMDLLGLSCGPTDIYFFDVFIAYSERGQGLAKPFYGAALSLLAETGYETAYDFFW